MIELSRHQHLDLIKALSESVGGKLRLLNNTIPACKAEGGNWLKFDSMAKVDAFKAAKHLGLKVTDVSPLFDRLGGAAIVKDNVRFISVFKEQIGQQKEVYLDIEPFAIEIKNALIDDGMAMPSSDFDEVLLRALKQTRIPSDVAGQLSLAGQKTIWSEHHFRMSLQEPGADALEVGNFGRRTLKDQSIAVKAMSSAAEEHYMRPELFVLEVKAALHQQNIALSFKGEPASLDSPSAPIDYFLKDVLMSYAKHGESAFSSAVEDLDLVYSPVKISNHTIGNKKGVSMLRSALARAKVGGSAEKRSTMGGLSESKMTLFSNLQLRKSLWSWRGVLNEVISSEPKERADAIDLSWREKVDNENISFDTPVDKIKQVVDKVNKIYGPLVTRHQEARVNKLATKISALTQRAEPVSECLMKLLNDTLSQGQDLIGRFELTDSLTSVLTDQFITDSTQSYVDQQELPDLSEIYNNIIEDPKQKYGYSAQPSYSLSEGGSRKIG